MDEKIPTGDLVEVEYIERPVRPQRSYRWLLATFGLLALLSFSRHIKFFPSCSNRQPPVIRSRKVALEAHIMSKCPDAQRCFDQLVGPVMANVSDKVDFALSYIGSISTDDDAVECMHGPEECLGNIIELCAANLYPDPKIYLGFTMCLTNDYSLIPQKELIHDCALEHGINFDDLNECASKDDGAFGMDLLRNSVMRTANAGVTKSCTVRLDDEIRCIMDGGEWKDCPGGHTVEDLINDIEKAADARV